MHTIMSFLAFLNNMYINDIGEKHEINKRGYGERTSVA